MCSSLKIIVLSEDLILCVISIVYTCIYACECIGLRNIVIMMYMYLAMLYPINDLNLNLN